LSASPQGVSGRSEPIVEAGSEEDKRLTCGDKARESGAWRTEVRAAAAVLALDQQLGQASVRFAGYGSIPG
jgi:hypothetical protein